MNKDLFAYLPIVAGILLVHAKYFNLGILLKGQMLLLRAFEILKGCKWIDMSEVQLGCVLEV